MEDYVHMYGRLYDMGKKRDLKGVMEARGKCGSCVVLCKLVSGQGVESSKTSESLERTKWLVTLKERLLMCGS